MKSTHTSSFVHSFQKMLHPAPLGLNIIALFCRVCTLYIFHSLFYFIFLFSCCFCFFRYNNRDIHLLLYFCSICNFYFWRLFAVLKTCMQTLWRKKHLVCRLKCIFVVIVVNWILECVSTSPTIIKTKNHTKTCEIHKTNNRKVFFFFLKKWKKLNWNTFAY